MLAYGSSGASPYARLPIVLANMLAHNQIQLPPHNPQCALTVPSVGHRFVLAIELGSPSTIIGQRFTSVFAACPTCAASGDLSGGWALLDVPTHIYRRDRYSACPTLRWYAGYFYLITLYDQVRTV